MMLCLLCPQCRFASYSAADDDCNLWGVCPMPLSKIDVPAEQHYTIELHNKSGYDV